MKTRFVLRSAGLLLAFRLDAGLLSETHTFANSPLPFTPPDSSPTPVSDTRTISGSEIVSLTDVNISFTLTNPSAGGAFNGDFYLSLSYHDDNAPENDRISVLLNRVGRRTPANPLNPTVGETLGYSDNGFNVTLDDEAANGDIHVYRATLSGGSHTTPVDVNFVQPLTGTWAPDGRDASPLTVLTSAPRPARLYIFDGLPADGEWTLQVIDFNGGGVATLSQWSLELSGNTVPEPAETAAMSGLALLAFAGLRYYRSKCAKAGR